MWLKMETIEESGKWEADLLEHMGEDLTWEQDYTVCISKNKLSRNP